MFLTRIRYSPATGATKASCEPPGSMLPYRSRTIGTCSPLGSRKYCRASGPTTASSTSHRPGIRDIEARGREALVRGELNGVPMGEQHGDAHRHIVIGRTAMISMRFANDDKTKSVPSALRPPRNWLAP